MRKINKLYIAIITFVLMFFLGSAVYANDETCDIGYTPNIEYNPDGKVECDVVNGKGLVTGDGFCHVVECNEGYSYYKGRCLVERYLPIKIPENLSASEVAPNSIKLSWVDNSDTSPDNYKIYRSKLAKKPSMDEEGIDVGKTTSYYVTGLELDTTYSFFVRGCNKYGCTDWSDVLTQKTLNLKVCLTSSGISNGSDQAGWNAFAAGVRSVLGNDLIGSPCNETLSANGCSMEHTNGRSVGINSANSLKAKYGF